MSFDTWTVSAVANQLRETIVPGRVQQVVQVDDASLAFEIYAQRQRFYLLASASQQTPRLHLLSDKPRRGVETASPLLQLLRKFVRDSLLVGIDQPDWERLLILRFEHPELGATHLVAELIGRWANLLLLRPAEKRKGKGKVESGAPRTRGEGWREKSGGFWNVYTDIGCRMERAGRRCLDNCTRRRQHRQAGRRTH